MRGYVWYVWSTSPLNCLYETRVTTKALGAAHSHIYTDYTILLTLISITAVVDNSSNTD